MDNCEPSCVQRRIVHLLFKQKIYYLLKVMHPANTLDTFSGYLGYKGPLDLTLSSNVPKLTIIKINI
jgi:hypothetical protein